MKLLIISALLTVSIQAFGKDLTCKCDDVSTGTHHQLSFHFASVESAKVDLKVTKDSGAAPDLCNQKDKNFTVAKSKNDSYRFTGVFQCQNQKPSNVEIDFDASTMTLPHDICHKDTIFHCSWNS
jgi:hypothetical protein